MMEATEGATNGFWPELQRRGLKVESRGDREQTRVD